MPRANSLKLVPYCTRWRSGGYGIEPRVEGRVLMEYVGGWEKGTEWVSNEPFEATLKIVELERGRSAARFWFEDVYSGTRYPFFGQGLVEMLSKTNMDHGVVSGTWIAVKRGANYGIEIYG